MMLIFWALFLLRVAAARPSVGVCIVLTNIDHQKHEAFAELSSLLASLAGQDVRRCLVSDLKAHKGTVTKRLLAHDANAAVDDWYFFSSTPVGDGVVDNQRLAQLLKDADYQGFLAMEIDFLHPDYSDEDEAVAQSVQELRRIASQVTYKLESTGKGRPHPI